MLTTEQKARIVKMRIEGRGYTAIARELSLNESTVRMYCVRNELTNRDLKNKDVCFQCGRSIKNGTKQCKSPPDRNKISSHLQRLRCRV